MHLEAANAAGTVTPAHKEIDWRFSDEHALIRGMLANDDFAWLEFLRRFDVILTARIKMRMSRFSRSLYSTALVEEIKGDVHSILYAAGAMKPLRGFDARHGSVSAWLCRIADHATMRRLMTVTTLDDEEE